jgi:hypothetical protein
MTNYADKAICTFLAIPLFLSFFFTPANAAAGPNAAWSFDSTLNGRYIDISGHGYDAAPSGTGLGLVAGVRGKALECPDTGYDIDILGSQDSFAMNTVTVETWFRPDSFPPMHAKLLDYSCVASGIRNGFSLYMVQQGNMEFSLASATSWITAHSSVALSLHKWYHVVGSYDGNYARIYVNGVQADSAQYSSGIKYSVGADARIGCMRLQNGTVWCYARGAIDEMKVYNYALTADSILSHYHNAVPATIVLIPVVPNPTYNQKPAFKWFSKKGVSVYRLEISSVPSFLSVIAAVPLSDTFYIPSASLPFGTVLWRVADDADTSMWSDVSSVTIQDTAVPILISYAPDPTRVRRPRLSWHHVTGATSFTVQVSSTASFASPFVSDGTADTFYTPGANLPIGSIFWHVKSNLKDQYSFVDTFLILNDSIPFLIPVYPDTQYIRKPVFRWHPGTGATLYRLQVDTVGDFAGPFISVPLSDTIDTPSVDLPYGRIFWRVNSNSLPNQYSTPDTFWVVYENSVLPRSSLAIPYRLSVSLDPQKYGIRIGYVLDRPAVLSFQLFSITGRCIATLWKGRSPAGEHFTLWHARDKRGAALPNGSYIFVCHLNERLVTQRILLTR